MSKDSSGRASLLNLEFLTCSSRIMVFSSIVRCLENTMASWGLLIGTLLWTYRTTPHRSTGETPFSLTYGAEAVIPLETGFPTTRTSSFNLKNNDEQLTRNLDLIEERREDVMVRLAYYQQKLK